MHATLDEVEQRLATTPTSSPSLQCVRGTPALLSHDLDAWRRSLRAGVDLMRRNASAAPSPYRGLLALLETVLGDGADERADLRSSGATVQACNRGALAYADAVAAGAGGARSAPLLAEADAVMAPLAWRHAHLRLLAAPAALRDGWGQPAEWLREAMAHFEDVGDAALARACREQLRAAGCRCPVAAAGRARSRRPAPAGRDQSRGRRPVARRRRAAQRDDRRAAVPVAAHGRDPRRQPARQDRCAGPGRSRGVRP
jgi:hypothetical protein